MHVFLSAAPDARPFCLPDLVAGFETEIEPGVREVEIEAIVPLVARDYTEADPDSAPETVRLVARASGRSYRGLDWWVVSRAR